VPLPCRSIRTDFGSSFGTIAVKVMVPSSSRVATGSTFGTVFMGSGRLNIWSSRRCTFTPVVEVEDGDDQVLQVAGFSAGTNLSALLRSWELNGKDYTLGR
jgi:hypothetical protein